MPSGNRKRWFPPACTARGKALDFPVLGNIQLFLGRDVQRESSFGFPVEDEGKTAVRLYCRADGLFRQLRRDARAFGENDDGLICALHGQENFEKRSFFRFAASIQAKE